MAVGFSDDGVGPQSNNTDSRPTNRTQTRAQSFSGGTGGGGSAPRPPRPVTPAPSRTTAPPPRPKSVKGKPINVPVFIPDPPPPPVSDPNVIDPPAKYPQPPAPAIPPPIVDIVERPERYKVSREGWAVSAVNEGVGNRKEIKPLEFRFGSRPELKPVLKSDGIVVKIGKWWMVSPQTLADLQNPDNPHYDIVENGRIGNTVLGKSVPIVELDLNTIVDLGRRRDIMNIKAGVRSVEYIYESPTVMGIPEALIDQINYTLDPNSKRPADTYHLWNIKLTGDYSMQPIKTYPRGTTVVNGITLDVPDKVKNREVLFSATQRMKGLREDLNTIKSMYFNGEIRADKRPSSYPETFRVESADGEPTFTAIPTYVIRTTSVESAIETPKPEPVTQAPPNPAAANEDRGSTKAIALWKGYGWTKEEGIILRNAASKTGQTAPFVKLATGDTIGIGGTMSWGPTIGPKAKVILPYKLPLPYDSKTLALATEYYGGAPNWEELNRIRIAELVSLTETIVELELDGGGKRY